MFSFLVVTLDINDDMVHDRINVVKEFMQRTLLSGNKPGLLLLLYMPLSQSMTTLEFLLAK